MVNKQAGHWKSRSSEIFFQVSSWDGSLKAGQKLPLNWRLAVEGSFYLRTCIWNLQTEVGKGFMWNQRCPGQAGFLDILAQEIKSFQNTKQVQERFCFLKNAAPKYQLLRCWKETVEGKLFRINQQGKSDTLKLVCACVCVCACTLSCVWLFVTSWTGALQAPLSMGFSRQESWNWLPFPTPGDLPNSGIECMSPELQVASLPPAPPGNANYFLPCRVFYISQRILTYPSSFSSYSHMTGYMVLVFPLFKACN